MKRFALSAIFVLATIFLLNACASTKEASTEPSGFQSTAAVAGEKTGGEGVGATAGPSGAGANVKW